jgi:probable rRNA maturation factor
MSDDPDPARPVEIDIAEPCAAWRQRLPAVDDLCISAARAALGTGLLASETAELSIVLADDPFSHDLNRRWRGQDKPTNVLAFPASNGPGAGVQAQLLGDVVIAYETVAAEAQAQEKPLADHLRHLIVHGVLHLLGYDHLADSDAACMEALEIRILAELGVPDPYRSHEGTHV